MANNLIMNKNIKQYYQSTRSKLKTISLSEEQKKHFGDNRVQIAENAVVLGQLPIIKNVKNGVLEIGINTVLNSDNINSITPVSSPVKFVLGINARIKVGADCTLNGSSIIAYESVTIGDRVQIGAGGMIIDTDLHPVDVDLRRNQTLGKPFPLESVERAPIIIEDDVWIGWGVIILKSVTVGCGSIIGAGSVVTRDVPAKSIVGGNPAKVIKYITSDKTENNKHYAVKL